MAGIGYFREAFNEKKILFSITNLIGGGAEKILLDTVKAMDKTKYDVYVFLC